MPLPLSVAKVIDVSQVGRLYHIGIGTTTPGQVTPDRLYGYNLVMDPARGVFREKTDLNAKSQLTQYSSAELIDRDFVNYPRVTDGDFSGGGLQVNYLDSRRFWDSDLAIRVPGYLQLEADWARLAVGTLTGAGGRQIVALNGNVYFTFGESNGNWYQALGATVTNLNPTVPAINVKLLETDGRFIYLHDQVNTLLRFDPTGPTYTTISAAIGLMAQMWYVNIGVGAAGGSGASGSGGSFLFYYKNSQLFKVDLSNNNIDIGIPLGQDSTHINFIVQDVVAYLGGVAILTYEFNGQMNYTEVWYHDGAQMQRIVRLDGFAGIGLTVCMGQLFLAAGSVNQSDVPALFRVGSGSVEMVARLGVPGIPNTAGVQINNPTPGPPRSYASTVYVPINRAPLSGIPGSPANYLVLYDILRGSLTHLPVMDGVDNWLGTNTVPRSFLVFGGQVIGPQRTGNTGSLQYQKTTNSRIGATSAAVYRPSGWMVTSRFDFNTPSITKLFRRITVYHSALASGDTIQVNAYVDTDPTIWTTALAVNPAGATITNTVIGSTLTVLTLPVRTLGTSIVYAIKITSGNQQTSPIVYYASMEIALPWSWEGWLDCTSKRRMLNGQDDDPQGVGAFDLYALLHNAWENAQPVTVVHPNGQTYTASIESLIFETSDPINKAQPDHPAEVEWWAYVLLRDSAV